MALGARVGRADCKGGALSASRGWGWIVLGSAGTLFVCFDTYRALFAGVVHKCIHDSKIIITAAVLVLTTSRGRYETTSAFILRTMQVWVWVLSAPGVLLLLL